MAGWAGFTDEDLKKLKVSGKDSHGNQFSGDGKFAVKKQAQIKRPRTNRSQFVSRQNEVPSQSLHPSERLSQPQNTKPVTNKPSKEVVSSNQNKVTAKTEEETGQQKVAQEAKSDENEARELDENEVLSSELNRMEHFQRQQRMIEEANKQKRNYLTKAINERKKAAKAESEKLTKIQKELSHLDDLLSADVSIIRDKIEEASLQYQDAQRKYEKAEQEFIKAKMNLFEKGEAKEQLTEHLYTIINQNEIRKAKKLSELMQQLEMEISMEEMELTIPAIPPLTNFNSVHTLNNPARKIPESSFHQNHVIGGGAQESHVTNENTNNSEHGTSERTDNVNNVTNERTDNINNVTSKKTDNIKTMADEKIPAEHNLTGESSPVKENVVHEKITNKEESNITGVSHLTNEKTQHISAAEKTDATLKSQNEEKSSGNENNSKLETTEMEVQKQTLQVGDNSNSDTLENRVYDSNQNNLNLTTKQNNLSSSLSVSEVNNNDNI